MALLDDKEKGPLNMNESSDLISPRTNACRIPCETENMSLEERKPKHADTLDLLMTFVSSLMERDYGKSLQLCKQVIDHEPGNKIALQFFPLLLRKNTEDYERKSHDSSSSESSSSSGGSSISSGGSSTSSGGSSSSSSTSTEDLSESEDSDSSESNDSDVDSDNLEAEGLRLADFKRSHSRKI